MSVARISTRYAKSLVDLAQEQGKLDRVKADIESFQSATENRDFMMLVKSPIVNTEKKNQIFDALFKNSFDEMTIKFMKIVLNKKREFYLPEVAESFIEQYQALKKATTISLTTATPLTDAEIAKIKEKFLQSSETRDNIDVVTQVDPKIIGGFIVEFGDKLYDASVAYKLTQLRKEFSN